MTSPTRKTLYSTVSDGSQDVEANAGDIAPLTYAVQTAAPLTAGTVTVNSGRCVILVINPAGTIATLTIALAGTPLDGDQVTVTSTQIVGTLTLNGGTILGPLTALVVGGFASFMYHSAIGKWLRIG